MRFPVFVHLLLTSLGCGALAQPASSVRADAGISELLSYSVPAEDWQEHLKKRKQAGWVPPPLPSLAPEDSADIDKLANCWRTDRSWSPSMGEPSAAMRERLLVYCEEHPALFETLAGRFPATQEGMVRRILKLHDRLATTASKDEEARDALPKVRHWLMTEAGLFRDELQREAESHFVEPDDVGRAAAFEAYQKFEPEAAKALLVKQAAAALPTARCTALLRLHAMQDVQAGRWRAELQALVTSDAPAVIRARALKALRNVEWPGKAEWVPGLFQDAALGFVQVNQYDKEEPLALMVQSAPDFWVPKVIPWVGNPNRVVHDNAVRCLAQFHLENKREDALRALLPWLSNPAWALDENHDGRLRLLQTLDSVNLPESVQGLLWALEHDSEHTLEAAASALAHYHATQAVPGLRKIVEQEAGLHDRKSLTKSLLDLEGLTSEEQARAVELYESLTLTKENRDALQEEWYSPPFREVKSIIAPEQRLLATAGLVLVDETAFQSPALAEALVKRVDELRKDNKQELAEAIEARISLWHTPAGIRLVASRLREGRYDASWLHDLLHTTHLPADVLKTLQGLPGSSVAIVALLLKDEKRMHLILDEGAPDAQAMLLACARLKRTPLPLEKVARLLESKHILCARGAERFLEAEDSPEARALILRRFKGEARILGARMRHDPGHYSYGDLGRLQNMLRKRVLTAGKPLEIHALLSAGYWGDVGQTWIEIEGDKARLVNDQGGERYRTRTLMAAELAELRAYMSGHRVDELPPLTLDVHDGIQYEYVHLTAEGGRRVFMNNPGSYSMRALEQGEEKISEDENDSVYVCLVKLFEKLVADKSKLTVSYGIADKVKGLRIVVPREQQSINAVMRQEGVLMVNKAAPEDRKGRWMAVNADGSFIPKSQVRGPMLRMHDAGFTEHLAVDEYSPNTSWRSTIMDGQLRAERRKKDDMSGIWLCREKQEPELIAKGTFGTPIASLDGAWAVAGRVLGSSWAEPNDMVRVNVATREIIPLKLAPADNFDPVARLPHSGRILVSRSRDEHAPGIEPEAGPEKPEYHLLDPANGSLERVTGEFRPLEDESWRPLQATDEPNVVWAALPKRDQDDVWSTSIGRYDLRSFTFTQLVELPRLYFTSMDFWVDAGTNTIFLAINGDLLSFPLPSRTKDK
ncbi:MAG: hypothetical protein IAE77_12280 [Prosthecobacter sp.]|uniref:HEAT repeat domain-containing protein n=1 Tax=Prosthecobacter sp. TaxID=1965333 RepID=UPI0019DC1F17|nr:HEAT repeat domain-containing protein [Prosthecobacter sp.]MBE2284225.1 hypothetical protein [Prosthecobacter sp.]